MKYLIEEADGRCVKATRDEFVQRSFLRLTARGSARTSTNWETMERVLLWAPEREWPDGEEPARTFLGIPIAGR